MVRNFILSLQIHLDNIYIKLEYQCHLADQDEMSKSYLPQNAFVILKLA